MVPSFRGETYKSRHVHPVASAKVPSFGQHSVEVRRIHVRRVRRARTAQTPAVLGIRELLLQLTDTLGQRCGSSPCFSRQRRTGGQGRCDLGGPVAEHWQGD